MFSLSGIKSGLTNRKSLPVIIIAAVAAFIILKKVKG